MNENAYAAYRAYRKRMFEEAMVDAEGQRDEACVYAEKMISPFVYFEQEFTLNQKKVK